MLAIPSRDHAVETKDWRWCRWRCCNHNRYSRRKSRGDDVVLTLPSKDHAANGNEAPAVEDAAGGDIAASYSL